jgi:glycosyltransferase involved in cell wall biosynthesis
MSMKVLWVLSELRASGAEMMAAVAAREWRRHGVELEILGTGPQIGRFAKGLRDCGYSVHHLPLTPFSSFAAGYVRLLKNARYDTVHIHQERANFYLGLLARAAGVRRVVRSVNSRFAFTGPRRLERTFQRSLLRWVGVQHVSISPTVRTNEWQRYRNRSELVYCWFDERAFSVPDPPQRAAARAAFHLGAGDVAVVTVGNCWAVKNHASMIRALRQLDPRFVYLHAGVGARSDEERQLSEELGVEDRIRFLGHVDDVPRLLHAADCYVMPSRYEGMGIAALEALASGVPSVLANVDGLGDLKPFFPDAWWIDPTPAAIAGAVLEVAAQPVSFREVVTPQLAATARSRFSTERLVPELIEVYRSTRARRGPRGSTKANG